MEDLTDIIWTKLHTRIAHGDNVLFLNQNKLGIFAQDLINIICA